MACVAPGKLFVPFSFFATRRASGRLVNKTKALRDRLGKLGIIFMSSIVPYRERNKWRSVRSVISSGRPPRKSQERLIALIGFLSVLSVLVSISPELFFPFSISSGSSSTIVCADAKGTSSVDVSIATSSLLCLDGSAVASAGASRVALSLSLKFDCKGGEV